MIATKEEKSEGPALLSIKSVAERCEVSPLTVRRWLDARRLPVVRLGIRTVRVTKAALEEFIAQGMVK